MQNRAAQNGTRTQKSTKKTILGKKEKRRLAQLFLCVALFLVVFIGKGIAPDAMKQSGEKLLEMIRADTDFKNTASVIGSVLKDEGAVLERLKTFAFNRPNEGPSEETATIYFDNRPSTAVVRKSLGIIPNQKSILSKMGFTPSEVNNEPLPDQAKQENGDEDAAANDTASSKPSTIIPEYSGPQLPAGATMEYYDLGLSETMTPVMGVLTSAYGYRDHPIGGQYSFHAGVDLAAEAGTEIAAFASGRVEFIGESQSYGLYVQLDHGNGVKSFYCHCSKLCVQKGEKVQMGQTIALVGETGNATGPHLHLEMEKDGVQLNPIYYISVAS